MLAQWLGDYLSEYVDNVDTDALQVRTKIGPLSWDGSKLRPRRMYPFYYVSYLMYIWNNLVRVPITAFSRNRPILKPHSQNSEAERSFNLSWATTHTGHVSQRHRTTNESQKLYYIADMGKFMLVPVLVQEVRKAVKSSCFPQFTTDVKKIWFWACVSADRLTWRWHEPRYSTGPTYIFDVFPWPICYFLLVGILQFSPVRSGISVKIL